MCGFIFRKSKNLRGQFGYLFHRGPDEQSYLSGDDFELEFSRLTITGSLEGSVPVYSNNKGWMVAFNGEIYNYKGLIESHGLPFTNSDTKVIANGLEKYGIDFFTNLRGMYAGIAIDMSTKATYVFRDPLGEKPLFFSYDQSQLLIASEFTSLLKLLDRPLALNQRAINDYFRFGYVEEPFTFDIGIHSVKRGAVFKLDDTFQLQEILSLKGFDEADVTLNLPSLLELLDSEVSSSSVPTGLALSAGIDSTSLLVAMSKYRDSDFVPLIVNINKIGSSQEALNAIESCKKLGITPNVVQSISDRSLVETLKSLSLANDQPHADPSGMSYLSIFRAAQEIGLKVVLLGHGPDELFWGYPWFNRKLMQTQRKVLPSRLGSRVYWDTPGKSSRLLHLLPTNKDSGQHAFSTDLYLTSSDPWERHRAEMVHSYLSSNGLRQSDRLAMASSIEPRTPYADSRLYGWAQRNSRKSQSIFDKREFRSAVNLGPLEITRNRKKEGFNSPMGTWFENPDVNGFANDCFNIVLNQDIEWRIKPKLVFLSPSEKYRMIMLGYWFSQFE